MRRYRGWIAPVVAISAVSLLLGLVYFQPQKLFLNERHNDPLPAVPATGGLPRGTSPQAVDRVLLNGELRSLEHRSSGSVRLIALADGNRILRFEALATSNGPDLHVYLVAPLAE